MGLLHNATVLPKQQASDINIFLLMSPSKTKAVGYGTYSLLFKQDNSERETVRDEKEIFKTEKKDRDRVQERVSSHSSSPSEPEPNAVWPDLV